MMEPTTILLVIALLYPVTTFIGFADGMVRLVTALIELVTEIIAIY
jgi:hypothetical protein